MSTNPEGPFNLIVNGTHDLFFMTAPLTPGAYWFKVTGVEPDAGETLASPLVGPVVITV